SSASGTPSPSESVIATLATGRPGCSRMTTLTAPHCCEPVTAARAARCAMPRWSSARPPLPCESSTSAKRRFASAAASSRGAHWSARCLRACATSFSAARMCSRAVPPVTQEQSASAATSRTRRILLAPRRGLVRGGLRPRDRRGRDLEGSGPALAAAALAGALDRVLREAEALPGQLLGCPVLRAALLLARLGRVQAGRDGPVRSEFLAVRGT